MTISEKEAEIHQNEMVNLLTQAVMLFAHRRGEKQVDGALVLSATMRFLLMQTVDLMASKEAPELALETLKIYHETALQILSAHEETRKGQGN